MTSPSTFPSTLHWGLDNTLRARFSFFGVNNSQLLCFLVYFDKILQGSLTLWQKGGCLTKFYPILVSPSLEVLPVLGWLNNLSLSLPSDLHPFKLEVLCFHCKSIKLAVSATIKPISQKIVADGKKECESVEVMLFTFVYLIP